VVRIDVDKKAGNLEPNPHYAIPTDGSGNAYFSVPSDNPYVGWPMSYNGAAIPEVDRYKVRTEIYATGFRNPFKFDIDQTTGDLWIGDVGMDLWEEVSRIQKGDDAGWSFWEGNHERTNIAHRKTVANPKFPEVEYPHGSDGNSVTGGLLYRGTAYPATGLQGKYIFGDFGSGKIWTLVRHFKQGGLPTGG
jgi:glucose/arabinose dehydrogenase